MQENCKIGEEDICQIRRLSYVTGDYEALARNIVIGRMQAKSNKLN